MGPVPLRLPPPVQDQGQGTPTANAVAPLPATLNPGLTLIEADVPTVAVPGAVNAHIIEHRRVREFHIPEVHTFHQVPNGYMVGVTNRGGRRRRTHIYLAIWLNVKLSKGKSHLKTI